MELEGLEKNGSMDSMHKKEASRLRHELGKLRRNLSGIAGMKELPGALFVVDIMRETIAVAEARKLGIPVIAMVDTNCDPDPIDFVIPANDDAIRAIKLIASALCDTIKKANADYAKVAAEAARKKEAEAKAKAEAEAKAKAAAKAKATAEKGKASKESKAKTADKKESKAKTKEIKKTPAKKPGSDSGTSGQTAKKPAPKKAEEKKSEDKNSTAEKK